MTSFPTFSQWITSSLGSIMVTILLSSAGKPFCGSGATGCLKLLYSRRSAVVVDTTAGSGGLTFASRMRNQYDSNIKASTCIETSHLF